MERQMYLDMQRERDEARAEVERLRETLRTDLNAISHFLRVAIPSERDRREIEGLAQARRSIREALNGKESP